MTGLLTTLTGSYLFDIRQFRRMSATGIFGDQKVELVAGKIYAMTDLPPHTLAVENFHETLRAMLPRDRWTIREEKPVLIGRFWAPRPDISVLRGANTNYATRNPRPRDVVLLAEISDTTYYRDRGQKWRRYAAAGIPVYMIVRLKGPDTLIEVWTGPTGRGQSARYTDVIRYSARAGESVPIEIDGSEQGQVAVADLIARPAQPRAGIRARERPIDRTCPRASWRSPHDGVLSISDDAPGRRGAGAFDSDRHRRRGAGGRR